MLVITLCVHVCSMCVLCVAPPGSRRTGAPRGRGRGLSPPAAAPCDSRSRASGARARTRSPTPVARRRATQCNPGTGSTRINSVTVSLEFRILRVSVSEHPTHRPLVERRSAAPSQRTARPRCACALCALSYSYYKGGTSVLLPLRRNSPQIIKTQNLFACYRSQRVHCGARADGRGRINTPTVQFTVRGIPRCEL